MNITILQDCHGIKFFPLENNLLMQRKKVKGILYTQVKRGRGGESSRYDCKVCLQRWTSFALTYICKTNLIILDEEFQWMRVNNIMTNMWIRRHMYTNSSTCRERKRLTSRSFLACSGDKCVFAPMNFNICSSVMPPYNQYSVCKSTVLDSLSFTSFQVL